MSMIYCDIYKIYIIYSFAIDRYLHVLTGDVAPLLRVLDHIVQLDLVCLQGLGAVQQELLAPDELVVAVGDHSLGRTLLCWPEYLVTSTWNVPSSGSSSMLWMMLVRGEELLALSRCHRDLPSRSGGMGRPGGGYWNTI